MNLAEVQSFFAGDKSGKILNQDAPETKNVRRAARQPTRKMATKRSKPLGEAETPPKKRSKVERYEADLAEQGLTVLEAAAIVDALVTDFYYEEEFSVTKKVRVAFRTRTPAVNKKFNSLMVTTKPQNEAAYFTFLAQVNLAASMVRYGDEEFDVDSEEGFNEAIDFVERLPQPLFSLLTDKLNQFDQKIVTVMRDGCIENF